MRKYRIDTINKTVVFEFSYDEELVKKIKLISYNARWNAELKQWIVPVDDFSKSRIIYFIKNNSFIPAEEKRSSEVKFDYSIPQEALDMLTAMCELKGLTYTPRNYQLESLAYSIQKRNLIIGDDVGIGKTFESIMYAEVSEAFPCLVIVPASVKGQWAEKWAEINGGKRTISTIESKETKKHKNNWDADIVIINYDIIGKKQGTGATVRFKELLKEWKSVIIDEGHFLKSAKSQRSKAAQKIVNIGNPRVALLTGTATMNKPVELWNLLKIIKKDDLIANDWMQFITKYCGGYRGKFGWVTDGATNTFELNQLLRETCYIRREKKDVLKELPDIIKQVLRTPIDNREKYDRAVDDFIKFVREEHGDEKAEKAMEAEHLVAMSMMRKLAIEGKMKAIEQYLKDWKEVSTEKMIIFGLHKEGLEYLSKKFNSKLISGGVSTEKKHTIVKDFIKNDELFLFGNMESMGTGVDGLQDVCSNMLIIELPWRPSDLEQAIGRLHRSGQTVPPNITFMLSNNTIDMDMWEMLAEKELVTEAVNKGIDVARNKSGIKNVISRILKKAKTENVKVLDSSL